MKLKPGVAPTPLTVAAAVARQIDVTAAVVVWAGSYETVVPPILQGERVGA